MRHPIRVPALLLAVSFIAACGSSGGDGSDGGGSSHTPDGGGSQTPDGGGSGAGALFPDLPGLVLSQGTFWEFRARHQEASASPSGTSVSQRIAHLRLELGVPRQIAGVDAFPLQATLDHPLAGAAIVPRWKYLAASEHQLLGSEDGATLQVLFDGVAGVWSGPAGFWEPFGASALVGARPGTADGDVVHVADVQVFQGNEQDFCHLVGDKLICDSSTSSSAGKSEHYLRGVGPLAYFESNRVDTGSGVATEDTVIELTATSLDPDGSFRRTPDAWRRIADLPQAVVQPRVVGYAGRIWVLGGTSHSQRTTAVQILDPSTGTWSVGPALPSAGHSIAAGVVTRTGPARGLIPATALWVVIDREVFYYAPTSGKWVKDTVGTGGVPAWVTGADLRATPVGPYLFVLPTNPSGYTSQETYAYDVRDGQWYQGSSWAPFSRRACSTALYDAAGDTLYSVSDSGPLAQEAPTGNADVGGRPAPEHAGSCNAAALLDGSIVVAGGELGNGAWDGTAVFDPATRTWREGAFLHVARSGAGAAVLDGRMYVVGGSEDGTDSAAVEVTSGL